MENESASAAQALNSVIRILSGLDEDARKRVISAVCTFFHVGLATSEAIQRINQWSSDERPSRPTFSSTNAPTAKHFMVDKQPQTDVERIACLAFYLTHFRDMPHFKTLDLAKLNTEAAQPKFSNTAYSATNAATRGYLAPAGKGLRQLSAAGEQFVRALPDREAAKTAMARLRRPKRRKK